MQQRLGWRVALKCNKSKWSRQWNPTNMWLNCCLAVAVAVDWGFSRRVAGAAAAAAAAAVAVAVAAAAWLGIRSCFLGWMRDFLGFLGSKESCHLWQWELEKRSWFYIGDEKGGWVLMLYTNYNVESKLKSISLKIKIILIKFFFFFFFYQHKYKSIISICRVLY